MVSFRTRSWIGECLLLICFVQVHDCAGIVKRNALSDYFGQYFGMMADAPQTSALDDVMMGDAPQMPAPAAMRNARQPEVRRKGKPQTASAPDPDIYLERFGYISAPRNGESHSPAARREAITEFQRMAGLSVTGRLDRNTLNKMAQPRCGMPDRLPMDADISRSRSRDEGPQEYYVPGHKWSKTSLSWRARSYSRDMSSGAQRRAFTNAFKYWSDVAPLTFRESSGNNVDIEINFGTYEHGDGYSFDGEGGTLAHAFYPETGDTHFDESEQWTENTDRGTNLEIVAAHEFGHALGLGHSNVQTALMAPFYQGYDANFELSSDDIAGIQSLYGPRSRPTSAPRPRTTPRPSKPSGGKPNSCTTKFDAVFQGSDGVIYVFKYKWAWRLHYWGMYSGYPVQSRELFENAPTNPGAAVYSFRTGYTYFFKSNYAYRYYQNRRVDRLTINSGNYQPAQAAVMASDGNIYLLRGSYYWRFDESRRQVVGNRARISSKWPGIPGNIEAAVRLNDGYIYFFKGDRYRKFDERRNRVVSGYPKDKAAPWMGPECSRNGQYVRK